MLIYFCVKMSRIFLDLSFEGNDNNVSVAPVDDSVMCPQKLIGVQLTMLCLSAVSNRGEVAAHLEIL